MSNEEYTHKSFWIKDEKLQWYKAQEKLVLLKIQEDLDKWFVATSTCPTVYKIQFKHDNKNI